MARIAGVNIPSNKRIDVALRYIHGIGPKLAQTICEKTNVPPERRVNQLSDAEILQIRETIDRDYAVEGDLRRDVAMNIKRLMDLALLSRPASSPRAAGAWSAHPYQCAHAQRPGQADRGQKEIRNCRSLRG